MSWWLGRHLWLGEGVQGRTILVARAQAMHEGHRRARDRRP
jgi:hypothetical protein